MSKKKSLSTVLGLSWVLVWWQACGKFLHDSDLTEDEQTLTGGGD